MRPGPILSVAVLLALTLPASAADKPRVDFERDVLPLLKDRCFPCHDGRKHTSGLRLDLKARALSGGESGKPAVVPGDSGKSELIRRIASTDADVAMPFQMERLSAAQIQTLRDWIDAGAVWPDALAGDDPSLRHWAFRPPVRPPIPAVKDAKWARNPLDRFVLARLEKEGLTPSPEADRTTLIRRLSLDLIGLPPTPEEVDAFLNDKAPDAYEKVGRSAAGLAALRRALGPPLARRRPLRRQRRLREGQAALRLVLPRLGRQRPQPRPALRPLHHRAAGRRPAAQRHAGPDRRHRLPAQLHD